MTIPDPPLTPPPSSYKGHAGEVKHAGHADGGGGAPQPFQVHQASRDSYHCYGGYCRVEGVIRWGGIRMRKLTEHGYVLNDPKDEKSM